MLEASHLRSWKTVLLLSIVIPISLTAAFRKEPLLPESLLMQPVLWSFERPNHGVYIDEKLDATYSDPKLSVSFALIIGVYQENNTAYNGNDVLTMRTEISAVTVDGNIGIESIRISFGKDNANSLTDWLGTYFELGNLSIVDQSWGRTFDGTYKEAYVYSRGINNPNEVSFAGTLIWGLASNNTETHRAQVAFEITYFNGTAYEKVIQPFELTLLGK